MAIKTYRANWAISGLGKKDLAGGDTIKIDEEDAAEMLKFGALTLVDKSAPAAAPAAGADNPPPGGGADDPPHSVAENG